MWTLPFVEILNDFCSDFSEHLSVRRFALCDEIIEIISVTLLKYLTEGDGTKFGIY